jgi:hypothetical protein
MSYCNDSIFESIKDKIEDAEYIITETKDDLLNIESNTDTVIDLIKMLNIDTAHDIASFESNKNEIISVIDDMRSTIKTLVKELEDIHK